MLKDNRFGWCFDYLFLLIDYWIYSNSLDKWPLRLQLNLSHFHMGNALRSSTKRKLLRKSFQFLFTLRKSCFNSSSWLKWLRISDRKFVIHTTEMILWSMILVLLHLLIYPIIFPFIKIIWVFDKKYHI